jgi:hypothetical protein
MLSRAFNPAGGVRYHLRAWRHSRARWAPFRAEVARWLVREWAPAEKRLAIIGASGGYCLDPAFLARFDEITCFDPDPLARHVFRARLPAALADRVRWRGEDLLRDPGRGALERALAGPGQALLFSNLLGQLHLLYPDEAELAAQRARVAEWLRARSAQGRAWASFHDRVSGPLAPRLPAGGLASPRRLTDAELLERCYSLPDPRATVGEIELVDHQTEGFFAESLPHRYFDWPLSPGHHHLIEAVCDKGQA